FSNTQCGSINKNTINGVFGKLEKPCITDLKPIEIGFRSEVKPGKAYIYTALDDEKPHMYEINIVKVYNNGEKTKNLLIKVTDKALIAKTGGIVQGMSGSPILQNGRLIGAVTHVMINDPTSGYGIFIENMLAENK
ncbi:MAG: SpoIVB peptidase S55 domain-containing protein, partial [Clostridia bacterium]